MEQLIEAFGIDVKLIVVQIINFAILVGLLSYFLYKPLLKVLQDREDKISQGVKDAEAAAKVRSEAENEKQSIVSEAHKEAEEVAARARVHAEEKAATILTSADEKAVGIVSNAEQKAEDIKIQARKDSEAEIAKLAVLAAEKVLQEKA